MKPFQAYIANSFTKRLLQKKSALACDKSYIPEVHQLEKLWILYIYSYI